MLNKIRIGIVATVVACLALDYALLSEREARAQNYPINNPSYVPNAVLSAATLSAPGTVNFQNNGVGTLVMRLSGTNTGVAGTLQCTESRATSPTYTNISVQTVAVGGTRVVNITGNGLYKANIAGYAQCQFNLTAISTGSVAVAMSGNGSDDYQSFLPASRITYSGASLIGTGATTHFLTIFGSATRTVRVTQVECSGFATTANNVQVTAEVVSTADSVDAGTAVTATPHDNLSPAATATVVKHTTSPTSGTLIGLVRAGSLMLGNAATIIPTKLTWDFGSRPGSQEIILRGVANGFALNSSAAFGSGGSVDCGLEWNEE